jgi:hypothetical protein
VSLFRAASPALSLLKCSYRFSLNVRHTYHERVNLVHLYLKGVIYVQFKYQDKMMREQAQISMGGKSRWCWPSLRRPSVEDSGIHRSLARAIPQFGGNLSTRLIRSRPNEKQLSGVGAR